MKKRAVAIILAAATALSLAACGSSGSSTSGGASSAASQAQDTSGASTEAASQAEEATSTAAAADAGDPWAGWKDIDTSEHVVINYMTTGDKPSGDAAKRLDEMLAKLNAILTEKCNAELQIYYIGWTDYLSNYNLTLAQMDGTVDLVGTSSDWLDAWKNAKNGAFLELSPEMLQTYAPATWASVPQEHWDNCKYNGDIYLMPEDNYAQWVNHGFIYRKDWAQEAGLSDGVNSWEDMTTYFEGVKKNHPDVTPWNSDGTQNVQLASGWVASHTNFVSIDGIASSALWGGTKDDPYTVVTPAYSDKDMMVKYAEFMKHWDEIGVWPTDVLNNAAGSANKDQYRVGQTAAEQHHTQTWTDLCSHTDANKIYQTDPKADSGFFYFGEETGNVVAMSITHGAMAVSAASANPERALMVYDLIRNDADCYDLFNYGIKGVSWDVNADGLRITPDGYNPDTDNINGMTNFWWGRNDDLEIKDATRNWDEIDPLYEKYDSIKIDYPYASFIPDVDAIQGEIDNVNEVYGNYMKQISFGKYQGSAEDIVNEMDEALKQAGIEEVTAELQSQLDAQYKNK